ncbi:unnamed protein product [Strongylus vulgaris]|uniref:Uncharacterized protein n=1 Tax=Strongylus vulgaris TaxID=40348 RepID=A0A3P7K812_STRVU|nr:unnamed protein product [Strongylus vulgaris]
MLTARLICARASAANAVFFASSRNFSRTTFVMAGVSIAVTYWLPIPMRSPGSRDVDRVMWIP